MCVAALLISPFSFHFYSARQSHFTQCRDGMSQAIVTEYEKKVVTEYGEY